MQIWSVVQLKHWINREPCPRKLFFEALKCFFVEFSQRLEFSSAVTPQQVLPSTSKDTLDEVRFWLDLFTPVSEISQL